MKPYYSDEWLTVYGGDCRMVLRSLEAESVHTVVTSPPYWGLRDYGTATWKGGEEGCDHPAPPRQPRNERPLGAFHGGSDEGNASREPDTRRVCLACGARRIDSQLGLEQTPEEYVAAMVDVFREVRRILRSDGTVWLNLGDSFAGSGKGAWSDDATREANRHRVKETYVPTRAESPTAGIVPAGLKHKDLVGIPWRVAFALQADGWYLRSDIIWSKPNPMPESVTDRPTKSHEYLFLLAKSAKYFFDGEAVRLPISPYNDGRVRVTPHGDHVLTNGHRKQEWREYETIKGANIRSVWTIATAPYPGAHFATFPPKLVEPCVKAGCPPDGVVLDPFAGTGTVGMVAQSLSRRAVLIDLNPDYLRQCLARNAQTPLGLMEEVS